MGIIDCPNIKGMNSHSCAGVKLLSLAYCRRVKNGPIVHLISCSSTVQYIILHGTNVNNALLEEANLMIKANEHRQALRISVDDGVYTGIENLSPRLMIN